MAGKLLQFFALILTALVLIPSGAHLFELPNKIGLARDQYFVVQGIYRGWALFGVVLFPAVATILALTVVRWRQGRAIGSVLVAFACMAATLAIFFTWTYPANVATANWTVAPENWASLRRQWEYAHAANAVLTFVALCALTLTMLGPRSGPSPRR